MHKSFRGKKLLAGLMLFTMLSSVVADSNVVTALAVDNEVNISESEIVLEKEEYQNDILIEDSTTSDQNSIPNILNENNALEEKNNSDKDNALTEDYQEDSLIEVTPDSNPNQEITPDKTPEIIEENNDFNKELIVDGYKIAIQAAEGVFPIGTKVEIETVDTIGDEDAQDIISEEVEEIEPNAQIVKTVTFDINFYSEDGEIIEPENGSVNITITPNLQETAELQEIENELGTALECSVFHVDDELNVEEVECEITEDYTEVSFEAESFSSYVVTWYAAPDADGNQEISTEGPKYIGGFEKVPFGFSDFKVPIAWDNDDGDDVLRPTELTFTIYGTDTANSGARVKICDVTIRDYDKTNSTIDLADEVAIPVYVLKGTGKKESGGKATYVMEGFKYEVQFHDENTAYKSKVPFAAVTTDREPNDAVWYASTAKITSERKNLADVSFNIEWYDNHNENNKRPYSNGENITDEDTLKTKVALYYCTASDPTPKAVTGDMMPAGQTKTGPFVSKDSYSTWSVSYENLLPVDENGNAVTYMLKLSDDFAPSYKSDSSTNDYIAVNDTRKYSLLGEFKAKIRWNDGGMEDASRPESSLTFVVKDGNGNVINVAPEDINITNKSGNIWDFEVDNLVMYSNDGVVSYYVTLDNSGLEHYGISYTNSPKSTDVTKCHEGGTIFVTRERDLESFTIHKKWVDNNNLTDRNNLIAKGVTLYLWRYPVKKIVNEVEVTGTIEDGAPVNKSNGEQCSYKLTLDDSKNENLEIHFDKFVESGKKLEMYDTQGYEYVYYVTEIMGGSEYVTSYSNVNPFTHIETAVANKGTLTNLRKESIKIEGIVKWRVPSITDYTKATATINLQRFDEDSNKWVNVGNSVTLAGFTEADPQKKHVFPAVDKYDDLGREIKYRVIETNVNYNGSDISVNNYKDVADKANNYVADDYKMNGYDYTATAHPTWPNPSTEAEKYSFTVDNRMAGDVVLDIKKIWKTKAEYSLGEGHYSDISIDIIQKNYLGNTTTFGTVKVEDVDSQTGAIAQSADGKCYATYTVTATGVNTSILVSTVDNDTNLIWSFEGIELPEFDSEGRAYTYSIKESNVAKTYTSYDYSFDGRDIEATVNNSYNDSGSGEHIYFEIDKEWIDGADLSQRQPVTIAIVNFNPETGKYSYEDNAGQKHEYILSAKNNWHVEDWLSRYYIDSDGVQQERFNRQTSPDQGFWTVIEENVSLRQNMKNLTV